MRYGAPGIERSGDSLVLDQGRSTLSTTAEPTDFAAAYDAHVADVLRVAARIVGDAAAEDVAHEVFLDLWRRPGQFDAGRGELGSFLRMKARSRALDACRRVAATSRLHERCTVALRHEAPVHVEDPTLAPSVRDAVRRLPDAQREAVALAYWGGLTCSEIADHCDLPIGTVKSRMRLGLARLAREVSVLHARPAYHPA